MSQLQLDFKNNQNQSKRKPSTSYQQLQPNQLQRNTVGISPAKDDDIKIPLVKAEPLQGEHYSYYMNMQEP